MGGGWDHGCEPARINHLGGQPSLSPHGDPCGGLVPVTDGDLRAEAEPCRLPC